MTPDYETAALRAAETLISCGINSAPVDPLPILKHTPGVLVLTYQDLSDDMAQDRSQVMSVYGETNQDAFTTVHLSDGAPRYIVTYNQRLPQFVVQRALARELAHIVLCHDGSRPETVRNAEAICFAHHLLCPRPLVHALQALNLRLTAEVLNNTTGCNDHCASCMRRIPATHVPADLNRQIRDNFMPYIVNFFNYQRSASLSDASALVDFGTYMEGYEE